METDALLDEVLASEAGADCVVDPDGDEPRTIRVLWSSPFEGVSLATGEYASTAPQAQVRTSDLVDVEPEQTVLEIKGGLYVVQKIERVEGSDDAWRNLVLRKAPDV